MDLKALFYPQTVAVIGASPQRRKLSSFPHRYLKKHGFKGEIYLINPGHERIDGLPCLPSIDQVPEKIDLALILMAAPQAVQALQECASNGVKAAVIFASGFAESGAEGRRLQEQIQALGKEGKMLICGPNSIGLANLNINLTASFNLAFELDHLNMAPAAFITQSGALGFGIFSLAQQERFGFNYVLSTGNEAVLSAADYLDFLVQQEDVKAVALYLESIRDPQKFLDACRRAASLNKPVIVLKVGKSAAGQKGASSHTAALAGEDGIYDAFFKKAGVIRVNSVEDLLRTTYLYTQSSLPQGNNVGIITGSGGAGIVMADACEEMGLEVPELSNEIQHEIGKIIPPYGASFNPVDATAEIIAKPDILQGCIEYLFNSEILDVIVVLLTVSGGSQGEQIAHSISEANKKTNKPILVSWTANERLNSSALDILDSAKVPHFKTPEQCARAIKNLVRLREIKQRKDEIISPDHIISHEHRKDAKDKVLDYLENIEENPTEYEIKNYVLKPYGIPVPPGEIVYTAEEAVSVAQRIGYPVALKPQSPDILHKTETGAVFLSLANGQQVADAYERMIEIVNRNYPGVKLKGILVEQMASFDYEMFMGVKVDKIFGPCIIFGLGGTFTEVLEDISINLAPLSKEEALSMLREIRAYPLLKGFRGKEGVQEDMLCEVLVNFSYMAFDLKEIVQELDINPLISLPGKKGILALDSALKIFPKSN